MTRTAPHHPADDCVPDATDHMQALGYEEPIPEREGIDALIDRAEAAEENLIAALDERSRLVGAVAFLLHVRDCDLPVWGENFCQVCRNAHDRNCRSPKAAERHETRWCDGDPYGVAIRLCREVLAAARDGQRDGIGLSALAGQALEELVGGTDG